jgi:hypothetical protein
VGVVYGIATDGIRFQFLRLGEDRKLQMSMDLKLSIPEQRLLIWNFIDHILATAIRCSLHTTPSKTFPTTSAQWSSKVESKFFILPSYLGEEVDEDDFDSVDEFEIELSGTPSKVKLVVSKQTSHFILFSWVLTK